MKLLKFGLVAILATSTMYASTFFVDKSHSSVGFKVKHMMISNVKGTFDIFEGQIEYDEKTKKVTALTGEIEADSINTANERRDDHLRSSDFFNVEEYEEITFTLRKIEDDNAYGKLTMHGITKDIKLEFENNGMITDSRGNLRIGISLNGKINRKDFGLTYNKLLEAGGLTIGEKIKLDIEIEGILQK